MSGLRLLRVQGQTASHLHAGLSIMKRLDEPVTSTLASLPVAAAAAAAVAVVSVAR